ncbi:hypothetical protein [Frigoriflavimonas asaccharolytica]|uniref:SprB-like repeat protein n=1 Tax=Frigoriflavimonas asaccharolytica TaxID=2735899 RepID=A0A8J8GC08_9FLAO|nr:hypothetical protein [Frigoriflavimonas asaccharolytica]NRS93175.1 hypothetical protein [Frigoriflavimonas asaccharolytica]
MKKNRLILFISAILLLINASVFAQSCPNTVSASVSSSPASNTNSNNGTITVSGFSTTTIVTVQLLSGPSTVQQKPATEPTILTGVAPGNYTVRLICSFNGSIVYQTTNITVAVNNTPPLSSAVVTASRNCSSAAGGNFTVSTVTGGTAPYQYSAILSANPNYPDASSVYSTNPSINVNAFGTYQVRVKDANGTFITYTRSITAVSAAVSSTPNTCGGNGAISVSGFSDTSGVSVQLLNGGSVVETKVATDPTGFTGLAAGNYQIKLVCSSNTSGVYQTTNITVAENYVPITNAPISVTNNCSNSDGGTFGIGPITGGTAPYQYSAILSGNPNYNDSSSSYGSNANIAVNAYGTYQIRIKDACGQFVTYTRTIDPISATIASTPNTCASNGTVVVSNYSSTTNVAAQLLSGGIVIQQIATVTDPTTFANLSAGNYKVRLVCSLNNNIKYQTTNITVAESYVPISNAVVASSNVCTSFAPGGTVNISSITGGNAPYQYSAYLSSDPAYDDTLSNYGNSPNVNVSAFGEYQVRVKDACGNFKTFRIVLKETVSPVAFTWSPKAICGSTTQATANGMNISSYLPNGLQLEIRADNASGAILYNGIYTGAPFTYTMSASHSYYVKTTTACGQVTIATNNLVTKEIFEFTSTPTSSLCGPDEGMVITTSFSGQTFWNFPVNVVVRNSGNTIVDSQSANEGGTVTTPKLPFGTYTVTSTDVCGNTLTKTVTTAQNLGNPVVSIQSYPKTVCDFEVDKVNVVLTITGYMPDVANSNLTILSGPSQVGVAGTYSNFTWTWTNLVPGNYVFRAINCGIIRDYPLTLVAAGNTLQQTLSSVGRSFCSGGGEINSTVVYNGGNTKVIEVLNLAGTVVYFNSTGNFTDIPVGTYTTRMLIQKCNDPAQYYFIPGSMVTITDSTTGPQISGATGIICEDASGNPLSTGSAYLNLVGVQPFKVSYKLASASTFTVINNASPNLVVPNLIANEAYNFVLVDACGGQDINNFTLNSIGTITTSSAAQPCYGSPYNVSVPQFAGASYEWTNPLGVVVSNTNAYSVSNFNPTLDGTYTCKIDWGGCVTRFVTVTLDGNLCGQPTNVCYDLPATTATGPDTQHGITLLQRAGADNGNWPMVRKSAHTALESNTKGFVITRIAKINLVNITDPEEGMMVYDTTDKCLKIFNGAAWSCFTNPACP